MTARLQYYPSKRSPGLAIGFGGLSLGWLWQGIAIARTAEPWLLKGSFMAVGVASAVFRLWLICGTDYALSETHLLACAGPFRLRVELATIREVFPVQAQVVIFALSLDCLAVCYQESGRPRLVNIAPRDRVAFLTALVARVPELQRQGDRLWRGELEPRGDEP